MEGEDSLECNIHGRHVKSFKHYLGHLFTVSHGVQWSLSKKYGLFLRGNMELIVEVVKLNLLHVIPVQQGT